MIKSKIILSIVLSCIVATNIIGQVSASFQAGMCASSIKEVPNGTNTFNEMVRANMAIGIILHSPTYDIGQLHVSSNISINYENKGTSIPIDPANSISNDSGREVLTLNYITIPAYFQGSLDVSDVEIFVDAGAYLATLMGANTKIKGKKVDDVGKQKEKLNIGNSETNDYVKRFDTGILAGAGVRYQQYNISIRYVMGLFNINPIPGDTKLYNRSLQVLLAYDF